MLDLSSLCQFVTPVLNVFQQVIDAVFGAFGFLGLTAPNLANLLSPIINCTS